MRRTIGTDRCRALGYRSRGRCNNNKTFAPNPMAENPPLLMAVWKPNGSYARSGMDPLARLDGGDTMKEIWIRYRGQRGRYSTWRSVAPSLTIKISGVLSSPSCTCTQLFSSGPLCHLPPFVAPPLERLYYPASRSLTCVYQTPRYPFPFPLTNENNHACLPNSRRLCAQ